MYGEVFQELGLGMGMAVYKLLLLVLQTCIVSTAFQVSRN